MEKVKLYKHKNFNQQLSEVKINYFRIGEKRLIDTDDDNEKSYLYLSLEKWIDLDCTEDFSRIIRKLGGLLSITSLAQVLNRKKEIFDILLEELNINPNLNSVLELLIAFVKDLGNDFYIYFIKTFKVLLKHLYSKNVELIENIFLCLAYLFKILWRNIIINIEVVFDLYSKNLLVDQKHDYIVMFASQSFAFLLRKFEQKNGTYKKLIQMMFDSIQKNTSLVNGVGYLLFEVIKGVQNQFNNSIEVLLPEILEEQNTEKYYSSLEVRACMSYFFEAISNFIEKDKTDFLWEAILKETKKLFTNGKLLNNLLLIQVLVKNKKSILVKDANILVKFISDLYLSCDQLLCEESKLVLNDIFSELLENQVTNLTIKNIHFHISTVLNSQINYEHKLVFIEKLNSYRFFERDVLFNFNNFLNFNIDCLKNPNDKVYKTLTEIVLSKNFNFDSSFMIKSNNLKISISKNNSDELFNLLTNQLDNDFDLDKIFKVILVIPVIETISLEKSSEFLLKVFNKCLNQLLNNDNDSKMKIRLAFLIHVTSTSIINTNYKDLISKIQLKNYFSLLENYCFSLPLLLSFKVYLDFLKKENILLNEEDKKIFEKLFFEHLINNLSHQHSKIRKLTLQIVQHFVDKQDESESVIDVCLLIENIKFTEPRETERLISKLDFLNSNLTTIKTFEDKYNYNFIAINYLLGAYYINYTLFWKTIQSTISRYAFNPKTSNEFWKNIHNCIIRTDEIIYNNFTNYIDEKNFYSNKESIDEQILKLHENDDRPDFLNYRYLILSLLESTPAIIEKYNRFIVQWFFNFLNKEISILLVSPALQTEDISKTDIENTFTQTTENLSSLDTDENEVESIFKNKSKIFKGFLKFLKIFSLIKNPLAIYEEEKLKELYYQLLESKDTNIQKAAFDCLKTYRFNFLIPYYENIEKLIDSISFKDELVKFNFASRNSEDSILQDPHRKNVMEIVMRILYGKLLHNFTSSKEGLVDSKLKKKLIFRYISDFNEDDIYLFLTIVFKRFSKYIKMSYEEIDEDLKKFTINNVVPCKQVFASTENLMMILENLGAIFPNLLAVLYKLIIIFLKYSCQILSENESIKKNSLHIIRQVRANCIKCLNVFFKTHSTYQFNNEDINVVFDTDFEKTLAQIPVDSLNYINPRLRLFSVWSENYESIIYLGKKLKTNSEVYPLKQMMIIYENRKADKTVIDLIMKIIHNLSITSLNNKSLLKIDNLVGLDENVSKESIGIALLLPFIDVIISRIEAKLNKKVNSKKNFSKNIISEIETDILISIGKYVNKESTCFSLIKLLIACLQRNKVETRNSDADLNILSIVENLTLFIKNDQEKLIKLIEPFFDIVKEKSSRIKLCQILENLCSNDESNKVSSNMIKRLNTYSKKLMDTFEIEDQFNAFKDVKKFLNENNFIKDGFFVKILIKNCVYFIKNHEDFVIKSECVSILNCLIEKICENSTQKQLKTILIDSLLLNEIKHGLKSENITTKQDFIEILRSLIDKGKLKHNYLKELSLLSNNEDSEQDFWKNVYNIQYYLRIKAINAINSQDTLSQISLELIVSFLLPMALNNIFETDNQFPALKESSIILLGKISSYLDWSNYIQLLTTHLKKLTSKQESTKITIRVICVILNNFNFDLSDNKDSAISNNLENNSIKTKTLINKSKEDKKLILKSIIENLLPKLHETLNKLSSLSMTYNNDKEKKMFIEDEEILRLPIAIALVKLLNSLPKETNLLENNIRNIILRIVSFLKSRAQSIRESARSTLVSVLKIIGPYYLNYVLKELQSILKRGYMFHVLTYTIYSLLNGISDKLKPLDLESSLDIIVEICNQELFSDAAEEKDVDKIKNKIMEASKTRSYDIYRLIGKYISTGSLVKIYFALKNELVQTTDPKIIRKIDNCLQKLCVGLVENLFIQNENMLLFLYGCMNDTIPQLKLNQGKSSKNNPFERMESLLIEPAKKIKTIKTNVRTNMHLMMLHYLQILHLILRKSKSEKKSLLLQKNNSFIEQFLPILVDQLSLKDPHIIAMSLRCLKSIVLKFENLKDIEIHQIKIKNNIFILLNKYGSYLQGENLDMKTLCFKMIVVLMNKTNVEVTNDQLKILLFYCDQDILNDSRQAQAFALLNSILDRKLNCDELKDLMIKLREVLIQSENDNIKQRCRNSWFKYFLNYVIGNQLQTSLLFFTKQLDYSKSSGRESVLRMFLLIVKFCPNIVLLKLIKYTLVPLSLRIMNEENVLCKKLSSKVIYILLTKIPQLNRNLIFKSIIIPWFESQEKEIKQLACHLLGLYCEIEKETFVINRYQQYLPILSDSLNPDNFSQNDNDLDFENEATAKQDHLIFALLLFLKKQIKVYPQMIRDEKYTPYLKLIWKHCEQKYLAHSHLWVRVTAIELFDSMLETYDEDEIIDSIKNKKNTNDYYLGNPIRVIWFLTRKTLYNLANIYDLESHSTLIIKHLTYLTLLFSKVEKYEYHDYEEDYLELLSKMKISWLFKRIVNEIRKEIKENSKQFIKRKIIYTWLREIILYKLDEQQVKLNLELLLTPVVRDLTDRFLHKLDLKSESNNYATSVQRVFNAFKKRLGENYVNKNYSKILMDINRKKIKKRGQRAIQSVLNPMKAIKLRQNKRLNSKKRKSENKFKKNKKRRVGK